MWKNCLWNFCMCLFKTQYTWTLSYRIPLFFRTNFYIWQCFLLYLWFCNWYYLYGLIYNICYFFHYHCVSFQITLIFKHLPDEYQSQFLSFETRRSLFFLFGRWCKRYYNVVGALDRLEASDEKVTIIILEICWN